MSSGWVDPVKVRQVSETLLEKGCYEVSLGDTIGVATPGKNRHLSIFKNPFQWQFSNFNDIRKNQKCQILTGAIAVVLKECLETIRPRQLALHLHDTYGQALANILVGLQHGIETFDSSVAGLGPRG